MVDLYPERQCCRSRIEHKSKRFFVLRRILDTRRKNVHIVNDSTVRQYHIDHGRRWVWRPSWGWRASPMTIQKDGCVRLCCVDVWISNIAIEMGRELTYTAKNDEYINRDLTSMRWLNVIVCGVARIQLRSWVLISSLHTMVDLYPERQCCRSSIKHISKRFFVLRRILDTRRKTFISSTTPQYVNATLITVEVEWRDHLGVEEHLRWAY